MLGKSPDLIEKRPFIRFGMVVEYALSVVCDQLLVVGGDELHFFRVGPTFCFHICITKSLLKFVECTDIVLVELFSHGIEKTDCDEGSNHNRQDGEAENVKE